MSDCPGLHCPGCGGKGGLIAVGGAAGAVALVVAFATEILIVAGTIVGAVLAVIVFFLVRAWRHGSRPSLNPLVAYSGLPEPEPRRPLPPPRTVNYNFYGFTADQVADAIARQAITRNERTSHHEEIPGNAGRADSTGPVARHGGR